MENFQEGSELRLSAVLEWADLVVVMEDEQRIELGKRFLELYMRKKILSLGVPDIFSRDDPELKSLLKEKMEMLL